MFPWRAFRRGAIPRQDPGGGQHRIGTGGRCRAGGGAALRDGDVGTPVHPAGHRRHDPAGAALCLGLTAFGDDWSAGDDRQPARYRLLSGQRRVFTTRPDLRYCTADQCRYADVADLLDLVPVNAACTLMKRDGSERGKK